VHKVVEVRAASLTPPEPPEAYSKVPQPRAVLAERFTVIGLSMSCPSSITDAYGSASLMIS
jgi:hypothetical protein